METQYKIIFTGPVGAGKTTAIGVISDIPPVSTEQKATDETAQKKEMTTVAMDYGNMRLETGEMIHLYGTPGQDRFNFMWKILSEGAIGLIVMIDNTTPDPIQDLKFFLEAFNESFSKFNIVIGVNKINQGVGPQLADYNNTLKAQGMILPVLEVDARVYDDVVMLIQALLYNIDPGLHSF